MRPATAARSRSDGAGPDGRERAAVRPSEAKRTLDAATPSHRMVTAASIQSRRPPSVWPRLSKIIHVVSDLQLSAIEALGDLTLPPNVTLRVAKAGELEPVNGGFQVGARGRGVLQAATATRKAAWLPCRTNCMRARPCAWPSASWIGQRTTCTAVPTAGNRYC